MNERDDRLVPLTRIAFTPLAVFTTIFGPLLLFWPSGTDVYWAWQIRPNISAAWVGAGYTFGAISIWTILIMGRWHKLYAPIAATWTFSTIMLLATLLHLDRFFVDRIQFWIWFAIYIFLPFGLPVVWLLNRRRAIPPRPDELRLPTPVVLILAAGGVVAWALGLLMIISPATASFWPWQLTPLMSRVIGGWILFIAAGATLPLIERRYVVYREFVPIAGIWFALILLAAVMNRSDFDFSRPATTLFFAVLIVLIPLLFGLSYIFERRYRGIRSRQASVAVSN